MLRRTVYTNTNFGKYVGGGQKGNCHTIQENNFEHQYYFGLSPTNYEHKGLLSNFRDMRIVKCGKSCSSGNGTWVALNNSID